MRVLVVLITAASLAVIPASALADSYENIAVDTSGTTTTCTTILTSNIDRSHWFGTSNTGCDKALAEIYMHMDLRQYEPLKGGFFELASDTEDCTYCASDSVSAVYTTPLSAGTYEQDVRVTLKILPNGKEDPWVFYEPGLCVLLDPTTLSCGYSKEYFL